ncbi:ATP-binding cassette subfamily B protein [Saccharothrix tamanrassetensis]|uniref:ATP-binding cassette subfamily B protein n=1 Tax=Saccharothrix tamanrassetensis TaxID=1051531 RepID=A0A841CIX5_9PSEU|nr:ABC transporter ATP-binding protein [Saccharothrix tamanrassetensis]MBB5958442.1 ATP-binding cassette subfamily B protein [Saccharothrix tamanrassetensis]
MNGWCSRGGSGRQQISDGESELFGGPLRGDTGFATHEHAIADTSLRRSLRELPRLVAGATRLAWHAERPGLVFVVLAAVGQCACGTTALLALLALLGDVLVPAQDLRAGVRAAIPAAAVLAGASAAGAVLRALSAAVTRRIEAKVERVSTERYLSAAAAVELDAIEDPAFQRLLQTAQTGATASRQMIDPSVRIVMSLLNLVATGVVLSVLQPVLTVLLVLIVIPRAWGAMRVAQRRHLSVLRWVEHLRASQLIGRMLTSRTAAPEVRVHGAGQYLLAHHHGLAEAAEAEQGRLAGAQARTELLTAAVSGALITATYALLAAMIFTGGLALATAGTAIMAIRSGVSGLNATVDHANRLHEQGLYVRDLERFAELARPRHIPRGGADLPESVRDVHFDGVGFTYPDSDRPALENIDLTVRTGQVLALVGENGSGKSTLVKLLAGLYLPDVGRIRWSDVDLADADRWQVFDRVGVLTQDLERWPFTVAANIHIGRPQGTPARSGIEDAVSYADASDIVAALRNGLDTLLARQFRGSSELSGGQWQKIGLARIHYRDPSILVVDEPTSALDPAAEVSIFEKIRGLAGPDRAVVLITHRMAAVRHADVICVLHRGRIVERGTHDELMARGGRYAEMYRIQADQYNEETVVRRTGGPTDRNIGGKSRNDGRHPLPGQP